MKGIEISQKFYEQFGKPTIEENFPEYASQIAIGLCGEGSECLGYDDLTSQDHDFEPGFCLFIPRRLEEKIGFKLERAYAKLPKEFMGLKRQTLSPTGGNRHGVITVEDFYTRFLGKPTPPQSLMEWLYTPSYALKQACSGKIFRDDLGEFSKIRQTLKNGYPEDVRLKKLAAHAVTMGQAGQYNFIRCVNRGEAGAAALATYEFVKSAISTIYLLNGEYEPYYKWAFRGMRDLEKLSELEFALVGLTELSNGKKEGAEKCEIIEDIARIIIAEYKAQGITSATCNNFETHAYSITDKIKDAEIRNLNIFEGI